MYLHGMELPHKTLGRRSKVCGWEEFDDCQEGNLQSRNRKRPGCNRALLSHECNGALDARRPKRHQAIEDRRSVLWVDSPIDNCLHGFSWECYASLEAGNPHRLPHRKATGEEPFGWDMF